MLLNHASAWCGGWAAHHLCTPSGARGRSTVVTPPAPWRQGSGPRVAPLPHSALCWLQLLFLPLHAGLDLEATHALKTCNCTVPVMAEGFADLLTGERQFKRFPKVTPIFAINGGAGAIFSRGLLQQIRVPQYEKCVLGKGPPIFAKCLGELAASWRQKDESMPSAPEPLG